MPKTKSGLNRMVTTTLREEQREIMERICKEHGYSSSGFVKAAIRLMFEKYGRLR